MTMDNIISFTEEFRGRTLYIVSEYPANLSGYIKWFSINYDSGKKPEYVVYSLYADELKQFITSLEESFDALEANMEVAASE